MKMFRDSLEEEVTSFLLVAEIGKAIFELSTASFVAPFAPFKLSSECVNSLTMCVYITRLYNLLAQALCKWKWFWLCTAQAVCAECRARTLKVL